MTIKRYWNSNEGGEARLIDFVRDEISFLQFLADSSSLRVLLR